MFTPDLMRQAQEMMGKLTPEQMKQMTEMATKMDPNMLRSMSANVSGGSGPSDEEFKRAQEQMQNMSPDQLKSQFEASQKLVHDKQHYLTRGAQTLKAEGNNLVKQENYAAAKEKYKLAIENLASTGATDHVLLESCRLNQALCHLKLEDYLACIATCDDILTTAGKPVVKALFRRGAACCNLSERLREGYVYLKRASLLSPNDGAINLEFDKQRERALALGLDLDAADKEAEGLNASNRQASASSQGPNMMDQMANMVDQMSPEQLGNMHKMATQMKGGDPNTPPPSAEQLKRNIAMQKGQLSNNFASPASSSNSIPTPSPEVMQDMLKDGNVMKQASSMMKDMTPEQLANMTGQSKEQCEGMKDAMKQMQENPEMMDQMSKMMQNMSPEDMERMMKMRGQGMPGMPAPSAAPAAGGAAPASPQDMMKDPEMMKTVESLFKSMPPEMLRDTMKAQGFDMSEKQAKLASKVVPILMALYRYFLYLKQMFAAYRRYILAFIVLIVGLYFF
eukprot:GEMP01013263.1.p1 GENE.GEMP01013263.1~~GEMP01013263.1.p1  ORF type:complete len:509 (+),score=136.77 GEMP01013263.1:167-1693(+)